MSKKFKGSYSYEEGYSFEIIVPDEVTSEQVEERLEEFVLDRRNEDEDFFPRSWKVYINGVHGDSSVHEFEEVKCCHVPEEGGGMLMSCPPQYKCGKCGEFFLCSETT